MRTFCYGTIAVIMSLAVLTPLTWAADWPQFMGPNRDGISAETGLADAWPEDGPKVLWNLFFKPKSQTRCGEAPVYFI